MALVLKPTTRPRKAAIPSAQRLRKVPAKTPKVENEQRKSIEQRLKDIGCDPFEIVANVAMGNVVKIGLMTQKELDAPGSYDMLGRALIPSGRVKSFDHIPLVLRVKAANELLAYIAPKMQAMTLANPDGTNMDVVAVQLYLPDNGRPKS